MAISFSAPASPARHVLNIEYFKGVDLYNSSSNVSESRSPEAPNMIRDQVGKVRKRMGFATKHSFPARVNGAFLLDNHRIIHAGTKLYLRGADGTWTELYTGMNDKRSRGIQFGGKLYLLDGLCYLVYDGKTVKKVSESAYVPTVIISAAPSGGGEAYEPYNLIGTGFTTSFLGSSGAVEYQVDPGLDATAITAEVLQTDGTWKAKVEGTDFTVNRVTGKITFTSPPGASPVTGVDNVHITAHKTRTGYADRINKCDIATLYGVGGSPDRLFIAGNPDHKNMDYYSEQNKPDFFGDTWFCMMGQDDAEIIGYTVMNNQLAAHKSGGTDGRNVVIRVGNLDGKKNAIFPIVNTLQGEAAISKYAFASMGTEALFLTGLGVYAITAQELTGEKYSQQRSLYISTALQEEPELSEAIAFVWRDFYIISVGGKLYLLDGLQKEYQKDTPYSSFQYEAYYCTGIDGRVLWEEDGALWFGTSGGKICSFFTDVDNPASYNDDGVAISAHWDTPDLGGSKFYKNKTFRYAAVRLAAATVTGVKIDAQVRGIWQQIYDAGEKARYLDWSYIDFSKFVFSSDRTPRTLGGKIKLKKVDKVRFRLKNEAKDEPFGLYSFALEFTEPGSNYKG